MKPLKLPLTISTPDFSDVPKSSEALAMMERRSTANIVEGYTLSNNLSPDELFKFYAEINIDNDKLWLLVKSLLVSFPEEVALIYQYIDEDDAKYGKYVDKYELINVLDYYEVELSQDGFFHFGIISHTEYELQEIFVDRTKYIKYWGIDQPQFEKMMEKFELYERKDLNFIDEYPVQTQVLSYINPNAKPTYEILNEFEDKFGNEQLL